MVVSTKVYELDTIPGSMFNISEILNSEMLNMLPGINSGLIKRDISKLISSPRVKNVHERQRKTIIDGTLTPGFTTATGKASGGRNMNVCQCGS